ncbi:MAG: hypothetical protein J0I99_01090 [Devosia sp.]|nr:hypothetical protein [Devosia sp.]
MRPILCRLLLVVSLLATPALGNELTPDSGAVSFRGLLQSADGHPGEFAVEAALDGGNFSGRATIAIAGKHLEAELVEARSYLENGKCILYLEQGRTRFELRGRCDGEQFGHQGSGAFDAYFDGEGQLRGDMTGSTSLGGMPPQSVRTESISIPTGKLTCAWQEVHISAEASVPNEYLIAYSMMVTLTLAPDGTYRTASASGTYAVAADKILLTSGAFAGAVGTLELDRSGEPAVVFHKAENRDRDGLQRIDPETTDCTLAN